jgi:hypothetical protein
VCDVTVKVSEGGKGDTVEVPEAGKGGHCMSRRPALQKMMRNSSKDTCPAV